MNVMICRSKHYADNHLSEEEYVPTKSDIENQPFILGGISFAKVLSINIYAALTNFMF